MPRTTELSRRRLTAALMRRQMLDRRHRMSAARAVGRLVALQAQYSPAPYIALHSRLEGFRPEGLERAIKRGTVLKSTLMRGTLHLVTASAYPMYASAWRAQFAKEMRGRNGDLGGREQEVVCALAEFTSLPRPSKEIRAYTDELAPGLKGNNDNLDYARAMLPLVHVPPSGLWRYHGPYSLVRRRGPLPPEGEATARLVRDYLAAYGPASRRDIAQFTFLRLRPIDVALAEIGPLRRFTAPSGEELYDLPRAPLPDEDAELPPRFLAPFDQALLAHGDRSRIVPDELLGPIVRNTNGMVPGTYLLDGMVAGTWRAETRGRTARLELTPMAGDGGHGGELEREGLRLLRFLHPEAEEHLVSASA